MVGPALHATEDKETLTAARFRRLFHRPDAIVLGYDERVLRPEDIRRARTAAPAPLRTMPFRREEPDPGAPVLLTLGAVGDRAGAGGFEAFGDDRWRAVWETLAAALVAAALPSLRAMVRFDYRRVIVRGDIAVVRPAEMVAALAHLPQFITEAIDAVEALPEEPHLLTAGFAAQAERWELEAAYGFRGMKWVRRFDVTRRVWVD